MKPPRVMPNGVTPLRAFLKDLSLWGGGSAIAVVAGALVVSWMGVFDIQASSGHWKITNWFLERTMRNSVRTYAHDIDVPRASLGDPDHVRLGAGHYAGGCAPCHGSPEQARNPALLAMLPPPTNLVEAVPTWQANHLFQIVKHGIKYSGMPAWAAQERDDEVWAMVAFLQQLPGMSAERYRTLTEGQPARKPQSVEGVLDHGTGLTALDACRRCHGDAEHGPRSALIPDLAGQKEAYLARSLREYASGRRPSGVMIASAAALDENKIADLAAYYARIARRPGKSGQAVAANRLPPNADDAARGALIAAAGIPEKTIPACHSCHRRSSDDLYPLLDGLSERYLTGQLRLWRSQTRTGTPAARIMTTIGARLSDDDISALAAYFATLPKPLPPAQQSDAGTAPEGSPDGRGVMQ